MRAFALGFCLRVVVGLTLVAGSSWAQAPAREHLGSIVYLLSNAEVRQDLQLSSLQAALLKSLRGEYRDSLRELSDPKRETEAQWAAAEKRFQELNRHINERALSILNASQRRRLSEIEHQALGAASLLRPAVQSALDLTGRQQQKIDKIARKSRESVGRINRQFADNRINAEERRQRLRKHRQAEGKSLWKVLTAEQRAAFVQLAGKPLKSDAVPAQRG